MKKIIAILLIALVALSFCACPATEVNTPEEVNVHITAGKVEAGMTVKDVFVEVTINNQPVPCRLKLTGFVWDGYWEMADDEKVEDRFAVRLDIYYSLPAGYDVEDVNITMDCDGGSYDGTGSISNDAQGNVEAWSRAFYGKEPLPPETEPITPVETQPTTPPETQPTQPTEAPTQPAHTHNWVEQPGVGILLCTVDGEKTFKCSCGETKTEVIPAPGHDLGAWTETPATCTQDGRKTASCKRCGAGYIVELPALGHTWSEWVRKTGRVHSRTCSVCGEEEEADHNIPAGSVTCTDCGADIIN